MGNLLFFSSPRLSAWMEIAAGIVLMAVMLLIGSDIIGRIFGSRSLVLMKLSPSRAD